LENLHRVTGCDCAYGVPANQAAAKLSPVTVPPDATVSLAEVGGLTSGSFAPDSFGRLSVTADGVISVTATFTLAQSVQGGFAALRLPDSSAPNLTAPAVVTAAVSGGSVTLAYTAQIAAGTSFEVDYWNGTGLYADILSGNLLAVLTP
jgi:hypothetical protein